MATVGLYHYVMLVNKLSSAFDGADYVLHSALPVNGDKGTIVQQSLDITVTCLEAASATSSIKALVATCSADNVVCKCGVSIKEHIKL